MGKIKMKYVMEIKARGRVYYYFRRNGYRYKLPDITSPDFSNRYHELLQQTETSVEYDPTTPGTINWLIKRYRQRPRYLKLAQNTRRGDELYFDIIKKGWGNAFVFAIRRMEVEDLIYEFAEQPGTTIKLLSAISKLMNYAMEMELRTNNPCKGVERPEIGEHTQWPASLLVAALASADDLFRRAVALHYFTGQRTSDACRMPRSALKTGEIHVRQMKKRGKLIIIPLHEKLSEILEGADMTAVTILENRKGGSLKPGAFRRWCVKFCEENNVEGFTPHGLRKNAVSALFELGCSAADVASITDQTIGTLEKYAKGRDQMLIARRTMSRWSDKV